MRQVLCPLVVGRDEELRLLADVIERTRAGSGGVVLLAGEAGIGKSRLAREAVAVAEREGLATLWGRAAAGPTPAPFRPIAHALLAAIRGRGLEEIPELAPYRQYLGHIVPEWADADGAQHSLVLVGEAVLRLLRAISPSAGCLLVMDDLHWADPETLAILEYLADNASSERLLIIGTLRIDESTAGQSLIRSLESRRAATVLKLERLTHEDSVRMASACLEMASVPQDLLQPLLGSSEGVPFLVEELLAAWASSGVLSSEASGWNLQGSVDGIVPLTFAEMVSGRLAALGDEARSVLHAAAVLGRRFDWSLLSPMTGLDETTVLRALRAGVDSQLLAADRQGDAYGFRFRHALTRDALGSDLLPPERSALARRARDAIEQEHPGLPGEWCELSADLAERAGDRSEASRLLVLAGRRALRRGALGSAETALSKARSLAGDDEEAAARAGEALVETLALAGKLDAAVEVGAEVLALRGVRAIEINLRLARAAVAVQRWEVASEHLERAKRAAGNVDRARIDSIAAQLAIGGGEPQRAAEFARSALAAAERDDLPEVACEALEVIGREARLRDLDDARRAFERAVEIAASHGLEVWRLRALAERATIDLLDCNDPTLLFRARELSERSGALTVTAVLDIQISTYYFSAIKPDELIETAQRATSAARRLRLGVLLPMAVLWEAAGHGLARGLDAMQPYVREAVDLAPGSPHVGAFAVANQALVALTYDDLDAARRLSEQCEAQARLDPVPSPWGGRGIRAILRTLADPADDEPRETLRASGATAYFNNRANLHACDAVAAGFRGDREGAEAHFARAEESYAVVPFHLRMGRRLVAEAALRDGWGDPVAWMREACDFFERKAGVPLARKGRGESEVPTALRAMGVTSREVDVLRLVAERLGNVEIAERLYLSPRTVEKHVASLIAKTHARDRRDLAGRAAALLGD